MENIDEIVEIVRKMLNEKLSALKILEDEKNNILNRYETATTKERDEIKKEMNESMTKYKELSNEVDILSKKIKKLLE